MSDNHTPPTYSAKNIESREGLMAMRGTPTLYFPDLEHGGITHSALEIIANSNDELIAHPHPNAKLVVVLCKDYERRTFQWIIKDTGRGIPFEANESGKSVFVTCLTKPHTSGKFDQNSYDISAGQFGVGLKASTAMSRVLRCITHRPEGTASLTVREGEHAPVPEIDLAYKTATGTTTICEPDSSIFAGVDTYADSGYTSVVSLLRQMVFFRFRNIEFRVSEEPIAESFWDNPNIPEADAYIEQLINQAPMIWDAKTNDGDEWIRSYWNLHRHFTWSKQIEMTAEEKDDFANTPELSRLRDVIIKLYYVKGDRAGGVFALVNSVPIPDRNSDHISVVVKGIKAAIAKLISIDDKRKFFEEQYSLPLFYAISVDYKGAKFANATKTAFREPAFRAIYTDLINRWFGDTPEGIEIILSLYKLLEDDIEQRYLDSLGDKTKSRDTGRVWTRLNKPNNFIDAEPPDGDRSSCELFLLEGKSTGGGTDYDIEHQGIYFMQGKPCNALRGTDGSRNAVLKNVLQHKILADILTLINYDPRHPDLSKLYFGGVRICCDADAHGGHIASLLMTAFQAIAPELVASGFFQVIVPPYYMITVGKNEEHRMYMREKRDLPQWCAQKIYIPRFKLEAHYREELGLAPHTFTPEEFTILTEIAFDYGLMIDNISAELSIVPELMECLCAVTHYLTKETMNTEVIKTATMSDHVSYDPFTNTLVVTYLEEDITIPLIYLRDRIYGPILSLLRKLNWMDWQLYITTVKTDTLVNRQVSLYQLYTILKTCREHLIKIEPLKGLGTMSPGDLTKTCLDPRNRKAIKITSLGDVQRIQSLMGKDSAARKQLGDSPQGGDVPDDY